MTFRIRAFLLAFIGAGLLFASGLAMANSAQHFSPEFQEVNWTELMPKDDLDALLNPPDYISQIALFLKQV